MPEPNCQDKLQTLRESWNTGPNTWKKTVTMCGGTGCQASRSMDVVEAVRAELSSRGLDKTIRLQMDL